MAILESSVADGIGILENGIATHGFQGHAMAPTQVKALNGDINEPAKDALKIEVVEKEKNLHKQRSRDASQLFKLGDRTILGKWLSRRCGCRPQKSLRPPLFRRVLDMTNSDTHG